MNPITSDNILNYMKSLVESKKAIPREDWLNAAFRLNLLRIDEAQLLNKMRQEVAQHKLSIMRHQEKRNIAAVDVEVETTDAYRFTKDQEDKLYSIDEFIRIAKKSSETNF
jgi:hypothetical protein